MVHWSPAAKPAGLVPWDWPAGSALLLPFLDSRTTTPLILITIPIYWVCCVEPPT